MQINIFVYIEFAKNIAKPLQQEKKVRQNKAIYHMYVYSRKLCPIIIILLYIII